MGTDASVHEESSIFKVVRNHEEQYSIWPEYKEIPKGWADVGKSGPKAECLAYIKEVWTDMRPLSLRQKMESARDIISVEPESARPSGPSLVDRLSVGEHPVELGLRPEKTIYFLREALERNYVFVRFTDTRGGTELGVRLDKVACELARADFTKGTGTIHLEGTLILNAVPVRCVVEVSLGTLSGTGRLVRQSNPKLADEL